MDPKHDATLQEDKRSPRHPYRLHRNSGYIQGEWACAASIVPTVNRGRPRLHSIQFVSRTFIEKLVRGNESISKNVTWFRGTLGKSMSI
mmetsp:Transcript_28419/g.60192  ORF Transcript_28419/g.60192 Transcript_28419/m.60192 type:complete len:89 (-) Transcript_28419:180-446(-)